jgi:hypothetical protein
MQRITGCALLVFLVLVTGCADFSNAPAAILSGQVLLISKPGPIPIGWVPPPLEQVNTVVVLNTEKQSIKEVLTDSFGKFSFSVDPGTYYLRVKESPIPAETGPFLCTAGGTTFAEAHFDNGMR